RLVLPESSSHRALRLSCLSFHPSSRPPLPTLSLHDALPICTAPTAARALGQSPATDVASTSRCAAAYAATRSPEVVASCASSREDRKSTRLNSSHQIISYAVFCLKKKSIRANNHREATEEHR